MPITHIKNIPDPYRTVYNPIEYVALSDETAEPRFKYIVEVYDGATKIGTLKVPAAPNLFGRADVQGIMESYLTKNLGTINNAVTAAAFEDCSSSYKTFTIKFGEEWETGGSLVANMYSDFDQTLITYNGCLPNYRDTITFSEYQVTDKYKDYTENAATRKFLTNIPKGVRPPDNNTQSVEITDKGFTYFLTSADGTIDEYKVFAYNSSNVLITTAVVTAVSSSIMTLIPSSPDSLNNILPATVDIGQPVIPTNCNHYYIELYKSGVAVSEKMHFKVTSECRYEVRRLEFLNSLGGFDTFNFTKVSRKSEEIERKFYKQNPDDMNADGSIDYSLTDKVKTQYYTKSSPKIKLNSDNISVDVYNWLVELIESPEIYMWENGERIAVQNIQGDWEQKRADTDSICNLEIEVELGIDNYRQRA